MSLCVANDLGVIELLLDMPAVGLWTADLQVTTEDASALVGGTAVTLSIDRGLELKGVVVPGRAGVFLDSARVRVVAGKGKLGALAKPKYYSGAPISLPLGDLVRGAGETLASTADSGFTNTQLPAWMVVAQPVSDAIANLVDVVPGTRWRMLPDGTLWVGPESWPDAADEALDYVTVDASPQEGKIVIGTDTVALLPGTVLDGRKVSHVTHRIQGEGVRSTVLFET